MLYRLEDILIKEEAAFFLKVYKTRSRAIEGCEDVEKHIRYNWGKPMGDRQVLKIDRIRLVKKELEKLPI